MKAFSSLTPPHSSLSLLFLYCDTDCRSFIRSLSRLKGLAGAVIKKKTNNNNTHTLAELGE